MDFILSLIDHYGTAEWTLLALLFASYTIQIIFYLVLYRKPYSFLKKQEKQMNPAPEEWPPVSVIIASKNHSEELKKNLPPILQQDYPRFEVIVVNCGSTDETDIVLNALQLQYPHLYHTYVPAETDVVTEKKLALTLGIKAAKNELLLFTEAYCRPCSDRWIRAFAREFSKGKEIVLGGSRLRMSKEVGLHRFIQYDNLIHHLKFLSMAIAQKTYMGIGRNMAYRKAIFFNNKGYSSILSIDDGEDDLFINKIARGKKTGVLLSTESMTETDGIDRFSDWRTLKSKYLYTQQYYKGFAVRLFGWETFSKYLFYTAFIAAMIKGIYGNDYLFAGAAILFFLIRYGIQLTVINHNSRMFQAGRYHIHLLFFDLLQPLNNARFRRYANRRNHFRH